MKTRWVIGVVIVLVSSLLGWFTSYAMINDILPGSVKTIKPKPEKDILAIDENSNDLVLSENKNQEELPVYEEKEEKPYRLFLIMGTDIVYSYSGKRTHSLTGRTDSIIIAKLSNNGIDLVSIPRDSRVNIPGHGYDKINSANVLGGPDLLLKTIEDWLKIHVEEYAIINTYGVVQFVDLFGGVDFYIPKRMHYNDYTAKLFINLFPGYQHLDGLKVHNFLRFRHDGMGDLNRVQRQQEIIRAIIPQILKPQNLLKIPSAINVLNENLETNISTPKLLFLAKKALEIPDLKNKITMHTIPGSGKMYHGGWYWFVNEKGTNKIFQDLGLLYENQNINLIDSEKKDIPTESPSATATVSGNESPVLPSPQVTISGGDLEKVN